MKKIRNTKMPADGNMPFGGYALSRQLNCGRIISYSIIRSYGMNDWQYAQEIKRVRLIMAGYDEDGNAPT